MHTGHTKGTQGHTKDTKWSLSLVIWLISSVSLENSANLLCVTSIFGSENIVNYIYLAYSVRIARNLRHAIEAIE